MKTNLLGVIGPYITSTMLIFTVEITAQTFDDFEDGDSSDWFFFGGNEAGGGGNASDDRPAAGLFYLDTGWGGAGSGSVFYGGFVKNLENDQQITLPEDPWFSVSYYVESGSTVDQFTLEFTLREDTDGEGYEEGEDDSFRFDLLVDSSTFDDTWKNLLVPISDFTHLTSGGDGIFNGNIDEIVVVIAGVVGDEATDVLIDFDSFSFATSPNTAVEEAQRISDVPSDFALNAAFPNPFNPSTTIEFSLAKADLVDLSIYNISGQKVRTLIANQYTSGKYAVHWDARNDAGAMVASGVYFYVMSTTSGFRQTQHLLFLK